MIIIPKSSLESLEHEFGLIRLIYHRNKNQHRVATWWKHLNQLKRYLTKLISLIHTYDRTKKENIRKDALHVAKNLYFIIFKKAYRAFNGIIALGQFITLGLTLVGALGKVHHEVGQIEGLKEAQKPMKKPVQGTSVVAEDITGDLGEEIGEEVGVPIVGHNEVNIGKKRKSSGFGESTNDNKKKKNKERAAGSSGSGSLKVKDIDSEKSSNDQTDKKKKKKKKKSAIDDIFG